MDPSRFVFLDETGASTNMTRRYGRCAKGERLVGAVLVLIAAALTYELHLPLLAFCWLYYGLLARWSAAGSGTRSTARCATARPATATG